MRFRITTERKQILKSLLILAFIPVIVLFFQNCSPSALSNLIGQNAASTKENGGNGEPYDGKPLHLRLVPGLSCGANVAVGSLEITGDTAKIIKTENACSGISNQVSTSQLEFSTFSTKYIGYEDGVYTYLENPNQNIKEGIFTEAWCRVMKADRSDSVAEFAVEWHDQGQQANLSVLTDKKAVPATASSLRLLDIDRVTYTNSNGTLKINFKQKLPGSFKVAGSFYGKINGVDQQLSAECLMGGQFDPVAPQFNYTGSTNKTLAVGQEVTDLNPVVNKSVVSFSLNGTLPRGLVFNSVTGSITGSAQELMARQKFLVSALFSFGQVTREVSVGVGRTQVVDQDALAANSKCANPAGDCSLEGAIALANQIAPIPLIIQLKRSLVNLSGTAFTVSGDVVISGILSAPSVLDAKSLSNHFNVTEKSYLQLNHLQLQGGKNFLGGSINVNKGTLTVTGVVFQNNLVFVSGDLAGNGGAIYATGSTLEVLNSKFIQNSAYFNGSGAGGGAIYIDKSISSVVRNSSFTENAAHLGAAIYVYGSYNDLLQISNCVFDKNKAISGGAIQTQTSDISISNSSFLNNSAIFDGGAIAFSLTNRAWISQSNFDGNSGSGFGSAAIYWLGLYSVSNTIYSSTLFILESQFTNHTSQTPNAAAILNMNGEVILRGSQLSDSNVANCKAMYTEQATIFSSLGGNSYGDSTCPL